MKIIKKNSLEKELESEIPMFVKQFIGKQTMYTFIGTFGHNEKFIFTMRAEDTEGNISIGDATKIDPEDSKNLIMRAIQSFQEYLVQTLGYRRPQEKIRVHLILPTQVKEALKKWHEEASIRGHERIETAKKWFQRELEKLREKYSRKIAAINKTKNKQNKTKIWKKLAKIKQKYFNELDKLKTKFAEKIAIDKKKKTRTSLKILANIIVAIGIGCAFYTCVNSIANNIDSSQAAIEKLDISVTTQWIHNTADNIRAYADQILQDVNSGETVASNIENLLKGAATTLKGIASGLDTIADGITTIGNTIIGLADNILDTINTIRNYITQLEDYITNARTEIGTNLQNYLGEAGALILDARSYIAAKLQHMREHGVTFHEGTWGPITVNPDENGDGIADAYFTNDPSDAPEGAQIIELSSEHQELYGYQYVVITNPDNPAAISVIDYFQNGNDAGGPWATALANAGTHYHDLVKVDKLLEQAYTEITAAQTSASNADQSLQNAQNVIDSIKAKLDDIESYALQIKDKVGDFNNPAEGTLASYMNQIRVKSDAIMSEVSKIDTSVDSSDASQYLSVIRGSYSNIEENALNIKSEAYKLATDDETVSKYAVFVSDLSTTKENTGVFLNTAKNTLKYLAIVGPLIMLGVPFLGTFLLVRGVYRGIKALYKFVQYKPINPEFVAVITEIV